MSGIDYLIDTNVLIYILQGNPAVRYFAQSEILSISVITEMEILGKYQISVAEKDTIEKALDNTYIIDIDSHIKQLTIKIRQQAKIKLPDAIVAATAMSKGLSLVTADKGFKKIPNLDLVLINI
jgi:predicted nucleic acid-binding protein